MAAPKPYPWKCPACRERTVAPAGLPSYSASLDHDGKTYEVELHDLPVLRCGHCGEVVFGDEAETRLSAALRDAAGLLHPAEIRGRREALGLTQRQLARRLRIAESTLSRWETGAQVQQKCMDLMLRSFFDVPELRRYLDAIEPAALPA